MILLPPSEGKRAPVRGRPMELHRLTLPGLAAARRHVLQALIDASSAPDAAARLGLGPSLAAEVARNVDLPTAPSATAASVYSGVLYAAADLEALTGSAKRRAGQHVRIVSALWGLLAPGDRIPAYRLSMGTPLPGISPLGTYWATHLGAALTGASCGVVLDCRSGAYTPAWTPPPGTPWVKVAVSQDRGGRRVSVSHHAKHTRGLLTGHLLRREAPMPRTVAGMAGAAHELVGTALVGAELHPPARSGAHTLELIVR